MRVCTRGWLGLDFVAISLVAIWSCALAWQLTFERTEKIPYTNYKDPGYHRLGALYFFCT